MLGIIFSGTTYSEKCSMTIWVLWCHFWLKCFKWVNFVEDFRGKKVILHFAENTDEVLSAVLLEIFNSFQNVLNVVDLFRQFANFRVGQKIGVPLQFWDLIVDSDGFGKFCLRGIQFGLLRDLQISSNKLNRLTDRL